MCGLVGIAGNTIMGHSKMFRTMLVFDQVRGIHSTGIALVPLTKDEPDVEKEEGCPNNLWQWGQSELLDINGVSKQLKKAYIGHNRHATKGKINEENAHPFTFGDITGAHNGSLTDWSDLEGYKDFDVDSKAIFKTIADKGIEHTWKSFRGAAALTWWDKSDGTMNFIRNDERPLVYVYSASKQCIIWASELWMITQAAVRNNVPLEKEDKQLIYREFEENHHYKFKVTAANVELISKTKLEPKPAPKVVHRPYGTSYYNNGGPAWGSRHGKGVSNWEPNTQWAKGLSKSDKEAYRGQVVTNVSWNFKYDAGKMDQHLRFTFEDNEFSEVLHVYCKNKKDFEFWEKMIRTGGYNNKSRFRIKGRPRIKVAGQNKPLVIATDTQNIVQLLRATPKEENNVIHLPDQSKPTSPCLYVGRAGLDVTLEVLESQYKEAGYACAWCNASLTPEMHSSVKWVDQQTCLCPDCKEDNDMWVYHRYGIGGVI